jgi:hypothetical protein
LTALVGATALLVSLAALLAEAAALLAAFTTQVPFEQVWLDPQSESFLQPAAWTGAAASSAAPSDTAEIHFQFIRSSLSARKRARRHML